MVKKLILIISIISIFVCNLKAKTPTKNEINKILNIDLGFRGGMSLSFPIGPLVEKASGMPFPGPVIGLNSRIYLTKKWSLQLGIDYHWNQTRFETPYANFTYAGPIQIKMPDGSIFEQVDTVNIYYAFVRDGKFKNCYLTLPLQTVYQVNSVWNLNWGGYVSLLLRGGMTGLATNVVLGDGSSSDFRLADDVPFDQSNQINKLDWGLNLGAGAQLPSGFCIDVRLMSGLGSLFKKEFTAPPGVYRNFSMQGTVGYRWQKKQRLK